MKFGQTLKELTANALFYSGLINFYRTVKKNKYPIILMYHKVKKEQFEKQINYLNTHYNLISLNNLITKLKSKKKFKPNTVVITFDDGYLVNFKDNYPILKKYDLPATIFLVTGLVGTKNKAWWDMLRYSILNTHLNNYIFKFENNIIHFDLSTDVSKNSSLDTLHKVFSTFNYNDRKKALEQLYGDLEIDISKFNEIDSEFMNWSQIKNMSKNKIDFGSHTVTHPFLSNLPIYERIVELTDSKNTILKKLKKKQIPFCYPSGDMNKKIKNQVKKVGYSSACSISKGNITPKSDLFSLERIGVNINDNTAIFALKLTGIWNIIAKRAKQHEYAT